MLRQARPDCFEDIIALVALYRPGPMDLIPDFCKRKHPNAGALSVSGSNNVSIPVVEVPVVPLATLPLVPLVPVPNR